MKLLNKFIGFNILYASLVLLVAIPVFYKIIQGIVAEDVDENLRARRHQVMHNLQKNDSTTITFYSIDPSLRLKPLDSFFTYEKLYRIKRWDRISHEKIPYRVLETNIEVNGKAYTLTLFNSLLDSDDLIGSLVLIVTIILAFIITGFILLTRFLSRRLWKPFYTTLSTLNNYRIEDSQQIPLGQTNIAEFTQLNSAIKALAERSHKTYIAQKEFTENASHEIQTPLAIVQTKIELLMQTAGLTGEQAELLSALQQAAIRMTRLNKTLLLLAKIENNQFPGKENLLLKSAVEKTLQQFGDMLTQHGIIVIADMQDAVLLANRDLIDTLLGNLLSNAIKHNYEGGKLHITLTADTLIIANTGADKALDNEKLFRRFQKQNTAIENTGLGLEIAKKICDVSGYTIAYSYSQPLHHFTAVFH